MNESSLPRAIREFVDATNDADTERFVAAFTDDAYLYDWGREFHGRDGIRAWNQSDNIGKQSRFEVVSCEATDEPERFILTLTVSGNGYNGTGPLEVTLRGDRIARVVIAES